MLETLATVPPVGGYASVTRIIVMIVLAAPWLLLCPWVYRDSRRVLAPPHVWTSAVLGAGTLGFVLWLFIPMYFVGLLAYVVLTAGTLIAYAAYRDGRVDEHKRVLTGKAILSIFRSRRRPREEAVEVDEKIKLYDHVGKVVPAPSDAAAGAGRVQAYNLAQEILYDVLYRRASHAEFVPKGQEARIRYVIDGVAVDRPSRSPAEIERVIQFLKPVAGLDVEERRRPQEGPVSVDTARGPVDMRVKTAGTAGGQLMQIRVIQEVVRTDLEELGMSSDVLEKVRAACNSDHGLIIVSGRPGSGVTSTLYSLLRDQDAFTKQLITLEAKETIDLENITQHNYEEASKLPSMLASALRRDPNVAMVDQCPDAKTADLIREAAEEKVILLGMHAGDSFKALARWVKACGDAGAAVKDLQAVLCQTLIRRLCEACREQYRPDPQLLAKANLKIGPNARFFRPPTKDLTDEKGRLVVCPACQNTRYVGRTGVFEMLELNDDIRRLVAEGGALAHIKAACRKSKMLYLQEQALRKVVAGVTSVKEVIRTTQKEKRE